jgi:hypothetical protein
LLVKKLQASDKKNVALLKTLAASEIGPAR